MPSLGNLFVNIGAKTDGLTRGVDKAEGKVTRLGRVVRRAAGNVAKIGAAAGIAGAALVTAFVTKGLKAIDSLAKMSDRIGIATENLQGLRHAAELTGVQAATLDMALQRMTRRVAEAAKGTGEAQDAIKELGLAAEDLAKMSPDEAFREIAGAMSNVTSQSDRVRLAFKLFDSEGVALVNTLRLGKQGLEEAQRELEAFGVLLNRVDARKVEEANDSFTRMGLITEGIRNRLTVELSPVITAVAKHISSAFTAAGSNMQTAIRDAVHAGVNAFADFLDAASRAVDFLANHPLTGQFGMLGLVLFGKKGAVIGGGIGLMLGQVQKLFDVVSGESMKSLTTIENRISEVTGELDALRQIERGGVNVDRDIEMLEDQLAGYREKKQELLELEGRSRNMSASSEELAETLREESGAADGAGEAMRGLADAMRNALTASQEASEGIDVPGLNLGRGSGLEDTGEGNKEAEREAERKEQLRQLNIERLSEFLATEREMEIKAHEQRMEWLLSANEQELEMLGGFHEAKEELTAKHQKRLSDIEKAAMSDREKFEAASMGKRVGIVANDLARMTQSVATENKAMFAINKAAAIATATVDAIKGAEKTWNAYPYPWNIPMTAAHVAGSVARLSSLASQSFSGGGGGGTAPSATAAGTGAAAGSQPTAGGNSQARTDVIINMEGGDDAMFSGRQVRNLIGRINDELDGGMRLRTG